MLFLSDDGTRVVFGTPEPLTADDTDHQFDSYLWTPGGVQKVTPGNGEQNANGWDWARPWSAARPTARTSCSSPASGSPATMPTTASTSTSGSPARSGG